MRRRRERFGAHQIAAQAALKLMPESVDNKASSCSPVQPFCGHSIKRSKRRALDS